MEMLITFPGGQQVAAQFGGMTVLTDQPHESGGDGSAPTPFALFLASLGTCAGIYVLSFCHHRDIPIAGITLHQHAEFVPTEDGKRRLAKVRIEITVPPDFPEKYHSALVKSAELCAVKKAILEPPEFSITTRVS